MTGCVPARPPTRIQSQLLTSHFALPKDFYGDDAVAGDIVRLCGNTFEDGEDSASGNDSVCACRSDSVLEPPRLIDSGIDTYSRTAAATTRTTKVPPEARTTKTYSPRRPRSRPTPRPSSRPSRVRPKRPGSTRLTSFRRRQLGFTSRQIPQSLMKELLSTSQPSAPFSPRASPDAA